MKNKKMIVMGIIIGILLIIIAVLGYVIVSGKKSDSENKDRMTNPRILQAISMLR